VFVQQKTSSFTTEEAVTKLSKLLLLLNILYKANRLREEQKSALKDLALKRDPLMFYALEAFEVRTQPERHHNKFSAIIHRKPGGRG
jgi:hypothetical protein